METLINIFGEGKVRISGRRSFGLRTPLDNIMTILLGAVLSRAVAGASPFVPVMLVCLLIACLHRLLGWLAASYPAVARFIEGEKVMLFEKGHFLDDHLKRAQVGKEDAMEGVRKSALTDDLDKIDRIYIERNGEISALRK